MDIQLAEKIRDVYSNELVIALKKQRYLAADQITHDIQLSLEAIRKEIRTGFVKKEREKKLGQKEDILSPDIIDMMKQQIGDTVQSGREHGFTLCGNHSISVAEEGTSNNIKLAKCPGLTMLFHTHPCNTPHPSEMDYAAAATVDSLKATCIGTSDAIRCFDPKTRQQLNEIPV